MTTTDFFEQSLRESAATKLAALEPCRDGVLRAIDAIVECYGNNGTVFFCGNGGSAADAQHLATELMIRLNHDITRPALGALSLATDPSNMTAGGNDIGFENVFARNLQGLGRRGDVLIAISTSGNSPNVVRAVERAREIGITSVGMLGGNGGRLAELCDIAIVAPTDNTQRIQELHITLGHIICESVERQLHGRP